MEKVFRIPAIRCEQCEGELRLLAGVARFKPSELSVKCTQCPFELDLLARTTDQVARSKDRLARVAKEVAESIKVARQSLPRNRADLQAAIRNPRHPFTGTVLSGLVLVAMELSGFGVFMAVTWILGNLILNPVGWVLVPTVVAIALSYRKKLTAERFSSLRDALDELEVKHRAGDMTDEEFTAARSESIEKWLA